VPRMRATLPPISGVAPALRAKQLRDAMADVVADLAHALDLLALGVLEGQSSRLSPGTTGPCSPQPIVTSIFAPRARSSVSFCGFRSTSSIASSTSGCTRAPGSVPGSSMRISGRSHLERSRRPVGAVFLVACGLSRGGGDAASFGSSDGVASSSNFLMACVSARSLSKASCASAISSRRSAFATTKRRLSR